MVEFNLIEGEFEAITRAPLFSQLQAKQMIALAILRSNLKMGEFKKKKKTAKSVTFVVIQSLFISIISTKLNF